MGALARFQGCGDVEAGGAAIGTRSICRISDTKPALEDLFGFHKAGLLNSWDLTINSYTILVLVVMEIVILLPTKVWTPLSTLRVDSISFNQTYS